MSDKDATETILTDPAGIARAAETLRSGGLVAVPTETVYGLAARADSADAVARIYAAKGRPSFNPLIVHVASIAQAMTLAEFPYDSEDVARRVWPGAVTLVLPRKKNADLAVNVTAGLDTVAIRMPQHPVMRTLIEACGVPLAAPSANRSNAISPTSPDHVLKTLDGRIDAILDGGVCDKGLESSILAIRQDGTWEELRPGPVDMTSLVGSVNLSGPAQPAGTAKIEAPGQLERHYSPGKPVRLDAETATDDEFLIGFGALVGDFSLSPSGDLNQAAVKLYAALHKAAQSSDAKIAVASIPDEGIGRAINDRLRRAAS